MTGRYFRPLLQSGRCHPDDAVSFGGGPLWFTHLEELGRNRDPRVVRPSAIPAAALDSIMCPRTSVGDVALSRPVIMGIVNVTPDSFSDGGQFDSVQSAARMAADLVADGADVLDIGGESTRPGAQTVDVAEEIRRTVPVIRAIRDSGINVPISIDTRKAKVAEAALDAGATIVNDVSGFTYDPDLAALCVQRGAFACVMHMKGDPATMHIAPSYEDVLLDVYDHLAARLDALDALNMDLRRVVIDPGIGFAKTLDHNLAVLSRISLFHGLSVPILLGVSRKRFIGTIGKAPQPINRTPGSIAVALAALAQGVQILRVHDVAETAQAVALWQAVQSGEFDG